MGRWNRLHVAKLVTVIRPKQLKISPSVGFSIRTKVQTAFKGVWNYFLLQHPSKEEEEKFKVL